MSNIANTKKSKSSVEYSQLKPQQSNIKRPSNNLLHKVNSDNNPTVSKVKEKEKEREAKVLDIKLDPYDAAKIISERMEKIILHNETPKYFERTKKQIKCPFYNKVLPDISLLEYFNRIIKYSKIEISTFLMMSIYIDLFCERNRFLLTKYNVLRMVFSAAMIALKYNEDMIYKDEIYAKIGGVTTDEMLELESHFAIGIDYRVFVKEGHYFYILKYLNTQTFNQSLQEGVTPIKESKEKTTNRDCSKNNLANAAVTATKKTSIKNEVK